MLASHEKRCRTSVTNTLAEQTSTSDFIGGAAGVTPVSRATPFTPTRLLLIIFAFLFALYPKVILGTETFFDRDFGLFTYPVAYYAREQLLHGHLPLWNPLNDCGTPFLAQWNTGVCYPLSIIYVVFPLPWSLNYFCLGHLLLAGLGMYLLARQWTGNPFAATVAGLAFALNGLAFNCLIWTSNLAALAWMPFVILFVSRGWTQGGRVSLLGVAAATMQMLAGAPEIALITWLFVGSLLVLFAATFSLSFSSSSSSSRLGNPSRPFNAPTLPRSHAFSGLAATVILVLALSAIQLLPFFQLLTNSDRTASDTNAAWSLPLSGLSNFLVPLFRCTKTILGSYIQVNQQWTNSYYVGIGIITLAIMAMFTIRDVRVRWLTAVLVFSILLALGNSAFLYPVFSHIPLFDSIRYPIKFISGAIFALPLLAAYGVAAAGKWDRSILIKNLSRTGVAVAVLTMMLLVIASFFPAPDELWSTTLSSGLTRLLLLGLILAAFFFCASSLHELAASDDSAPLQRAPTLHASRSYALSSFLMLALLGLDAITHSPRQNPTVPNSAYARLSHAMTEPPQLGLSRAMVSPQAQAILDRASLPDPLAYYLGNRKALFQNCNLLDDIPKLNGFFSLHLRDYADIKGIIYQPTNYPAGLIDFLGVSQLTADDNFWNWVPRKSAMPLLTGGQKVIFADSNETIDTLTKQMFPARDAVCLEPSAAASITATNPTHVIIQQKLFSTQRIEASVTAADSAMVAISQSYFPAWKAFIDGKPAALFRANHAFQAVEVPSGTHDLVLVYTDTWFYTGAGISIFALLLCVFLWFRFPNQATR